eukprot:311850-Chlamydomonas_euryale.AAC.1
MHRLAKSRCLAKSRRLASSSHAHGRLRAKTCTLQAVQIGVYTRCVRTRCIHTCFVHTERVTHTERATHAASTRAAPVTALGPASMSRVLPTPVA